MTTPDTSSRTLSRRDVAPPFRRGGWRSAALVALVCIALSGGISSAFDVPPAPPRFVHDEARLLQAPERAALEGRLGQLAQERGLQIGIGLFPSLQGEPIEEVSLAIAEAWQPGFAGRDDGVLITVFQQDRKMRIEVGYGLEGAVPDAIAARIIRQRMAPRFRQGDFGGGLAAAVDAVAAAAAGETLPPVAEGQNRKARRIGVALFFLMAFVFGVFHIVASVAMSTRDIDRHGRPRDDLPAWLLWWYTLNRGSYHRGHRNDSGRWGGGGGFGGGGFGGGGFGGGGFGGGSFGGGGASGSW